MHACMDAAVNRSQSSALFLLFHFYLAASHLRTYMRGRSLLCERSYVHCPRQFLGHIFRIRELRHDDDDTDGYPANYLYEEGWTRKMRILQKTEFPEFSVLIYYVRDAMDGSRAAAAAISLIKAACHPVSQ